MIYLCVLTVRHSLSAPTVQYVRQKTSVRAKLMLMRNTDREGAALSHGKLRQMQKKEGNSWKKGGKKGDRKGGERNDSPGKGGCLGEKQQHMYCWRP